ncbi:MAG: porin [Pseudomonadota bacterium]
MNIRILTSALLAVLGINATGTAQAQTSSQSSVSVYGIFDLNVSSIRTGSAAGSHVVVMSPSATSTSLLGFRGVEDLGGGLQAIFNIESRISGDTGVGGGTAFSGANAGTASTYDLSTYVGLKNNLGRITVGRNLTSAVFALLNGNAIPSGPNTGMVVATSPQGLSNDYWNSNQIKVESAVYNGFSAQINYAPGEQAGDSRAGSNLGGALTWQEGGFRVVGGSQRDNDKTGHHVRWDALMASYVAPGYKYKLTGGATRVVNPGTGVTALGLPWRDSNMLTVGGNYNINGPLTLAAQFYRMKENLKGTTSKLLVLNANYALSVRTALNLFINRSNSGAVAINPLSGGPAAAPNASASAFTLGIKHVF